MSKKKYSIDTPLNETERFHFLDALYISIGGTLEFATQDERVFHYFYEAMGGLDGSGIMPLWTGYDKSDRKAFFKAFKRLGYVELADRLRAIDKWMVKVPGYKKSSPKLNGDQRGIVDEMNADLRKLTVDREVKMFEFVREFVIRKLTN